MGIIWDNGQPTIKVNPTKHPKKITGTRFAGVLGMNPWATQFETWCAITRTYEEPFVENKYTLAGKAIEPIIIQYLRDVYFGGDEVVDPTQVFGPDPFKTTRGDFFKDSKIFGGMWDALLLDDGKNIAVIEIKTTGRIDKWEKGAPDYQALQGALYAHLIGVDTVLMVVAVLEESDYTNPGAFKPSVENVIIDEFNIYDRYPKFAEQVAYAEDWWAKYVTTGVSPYYDAKKDAEILKALRTTTVDPEDEFTKILAEAGALKIELENHKAEVKDKTSKLKKLEEIIKERLTEQMGEDNKVAVAETGTILYYELTKTSKESIDTDQMKKDGVLKKYTITTESYTLRTKKKKE